MYLHKPFSTSRMWRKANFQMEYSSIGFPGLIFFPTLKNLLYSTSCLQGGTIKLSPKKRWHDSISVKWKPVFFFVADTVITVARVVKKPSFPFFWWEGGCLRGVMVKAMDCRIVVCEFVLQSRYYVHFRTNTLGKGMNPLILPAMG